MKTTVDRRFLIGLFIGAVILGAAVHVLHAVQINRQSRFLLEEARRAQKAEQVEVAASRFQQYVKLVPDDIDAQAEFGQFLTDHHAAREAAVVLENLLRAVPDRDDLRRRLVTGEMSIGRWTDAKAHLQRLLAKLPGDAALWDLLGTCQAADGEFGLAAESLQKSVGRDPHQADAYEHLAEVLRRLDRSAEADAWMEKLVRANPEAARAHLLAGRYLAEIGREQEARQQSQKALELAPKDSDVLLLASRLAAAKAAYDQAREYAQRAIDSAPTNSAAYLVLAQVEMLAGSPTRAIACLEKGVEQTQSRDEAILWELGRLRIKQGDLAGGQSILDTLHKFPVDDRFEPLIGYLEAQFELAGQHWRAAIQRLEQVAPQLVRSPDLLKEVRYQVAVCHERMGNTELQLSAYREAAAIDPAWAPARLGIANTLLALGKLDEALDEFRQIAQLEGMSGEGAAGVAKLLILRNLSRAPVERDWKEVDGLLDQLAQHNPDSVGVTLLRAEALAGQQQSDEAEKLLIAAQTKSPDQVELRKALMGLAIRREQWPRVEQLLAEADKKFGDQIWLRLARGSYVLAHYKQDATTRLKSLSDNAGGFSPADRLQLYRGLAGLWLGTGEIAQAIRYARLACDADPQNLEARLFLFDVALDTGDAPVVKKVVQEIRELEGEGPLWHYGEAALCLLSKPATAALDEAAFQHISAARNLRPDWPALSLLTARIQDRRGEHTAALQSYLEAIQLGEHSSGAVRRATELLYAAQRYSEADQLLRHFEQQPTLFSGDIERMASKVSARLDDLDRALVLARKVAADSRDWQDQVWLGQLQGLVGLQAQSAGRSDESKSRLTEAETSLRAAIQLKPEAPEPWVALIRFYAALGRTTDAEAAIRQAQSKLPAQTAALAMAASYEALGNVAEASKQYQLALSHPDQSALAVRQAAEFEMRCGKFAEAEAHLRMIVGGQVGAQPDEVASARRALAAILRASGSYPKIQDALAIIELNLAGGAAPEDLREKAFALAVCPQPERRREAISILEGLLLKQPGADDLRLALVQLYLADSNWSRAEKLSRDLVTSHEQDPRYMALYVARLLDRQETDEADFWLQRLEQIAPNDFTTASLKAGTLVQRGKVDEAIQTLHDSLAQPKLSAAESLARTRLVAGRLEELARSAAGPDRSATSAKLISEAESLYRKYVKQQPDQQLVLANFLGRRGKFDEAVTLVEAAQPNADPAALAQVYVDLIERGLGSTTAEPRVERLLRGAIDQHDGATMLRLALAALRMRQERFNDAASIYREVLQQDPSNVVAMNNLANLLALQKKQLDEALRLVEKAIALAGPLPTLLDSRASIYLALGKPQEALADLEQAIGMESRPNRQFHRAQAYFQLGDTKAAMQALGEARKLGLKPADLSPLERPAFQDLAAELQQHGS